MDEITFSVMRNTEQTEPVLRRVLDVFEHIHKVRVNLQVLLWQAARQEIKKFALQQRGPDVSAVGTTWVTDLIAMNAIQPIKDRHAGGVLGKQEEFIKAVWEITRGEKREDLYSFPWLVDTYVIHYRRDLLEKAGLNPNTAFSNFGQLAETTSRLKEAGVLIPIQLPYSYDRFCMLHTLAAWVWEKGGEFCTPDGKQVLFDSPEALQGILDYFHLANQLPPLARQQLLSSNSSELFRQGQAGLAFGTYSFMFDPDSILPAVRENWAAAPLPEPHFVGGVNLVTWKYSRRDQLAHELIRFLNLPEVVLEVSQAMLTSPARLDVLTGPIYMQDPILNVVSASARSGRGYLPVPLWGLIEDRLCEALVTVSANVLDSADGSADEMIMQIIKATAKRLNLTLDTR
jgi:multiple sugar transport system substrate-binding protein